MVVMGIDPGSQITGYGMISIAAGEAPRYIACGAIRTSSRDDFSARLKQIYDEVADLIAAHQPDQAALEEIFYARNARSSLLLGQARASAVLAALNEPVQWDDPDYDGSIGCFLDAERATTLDIEAMHTDMSLSISRIDELLAQRRKA